MAVAIATVPAADGNPALGQLWKYFETGAYWYSDNLSDILRSEVQKRCRFRQFTDIPDDIQGGKLHAGDTFHFNIYSEVEAAIDTTALDEEGDIPLSRMRAAQGQVTVQEYGLSVNYTGIFDDLSLHPVRELITKKLKIHNARKYDLLAFKEWEKTQLKVTPQGGNSATAIDFTENGTPANANAAPMTWAHVKQMSRLARERDIPTYDHGDYYMLARPNTYAAVEDDLESIYRYTDGGFRRVVDGEKGRANGVRFVEQTNINAANSALGAPWGSGASDDAFMFGDDAVYECMVLPEEIRGRIPESYGRKKGVAWYGVTAFAKTRQKASDERILHWSSTG